MTPRQIAMLLALAALWGASFLFMRVAVPELGPVVLADGRVAIAGLALLAYATAIGARPALRARWRDYLLLGAVNAALPFTLLAAAELEIEASLAAVLNAMAPMCGAIVGAVWLRRRQACPCPKRLRNARSPTSRRFTRSCRPTVIARLS